MLIELIAPIALFTRPMIALIGVFTMPTSPEKAASNTEAIVPTTEITPSITGMSA